MYDFGSRSKKLPQSSLTETQHEMRATQPDDSLLNIFPMEVREKIYKFALTAKNGTIVLSGRKFKRNIAVSLLATCKQIYHEATPMLYQVNTFIFKNAGADLRQVVKPLGLNSCWETEDCSVAVCNPVFRKVVFDLGHDKRAFHGALDYEGFGYALKEIRGTLIVEQLELFFRRYCFGLTSKPFR
ncbi:hypothetical protein MMC12_005567 [Toensbergia leucococca]|nr:hypothetical protein [Toensbergia leucococca]